MTKSFALGRNYIHLADGGASAQVPVGPDFWQRIGERRELHEGRLLTFFHLGPGNVHWERHPAGDEILILLSGATALLVEEDGKQRRAAKSRRSVHRAARPVARFRRLGAGRPAGDYPRRRDGNAHRLTDSATLSIFASWFRPLDSLG